MDSRAVLRTLLNIQDGAFFEKSFAKSPHVSIWQGSEYASEQSFFLPQWYMTLHDSDYLPAWGAKFSYISKVMLCITEVRKEKA